MLGGGAERGCPPYYLQSLVFLQSLQNVLFKVKLVINNAPLTYVYPNTVETYLTAIHLLLGRQLSNSFNTTSAVVKNLTVPSSIMMNI